MFAETQNLAVQLDLKGNLKAGLRDASRAVQGFDKATSNTQRSLSKFGSNIQRGIAVGLAATTGAFATVVKAASDYESAFAGVRKTVTATEPQLQKLSDAFRKLSREIPISASELARLGEAGGALGVPTAQLEEFVRVTALLGVTTDLTSDQAADSLGVLGNVLHLTGAEYSKFASSLVALGNAGASTESQIIGIAQRAGAAGELIGLSTEQVLGFSSAVASLGIEVEAGGSSLQKFFIDVTKAVSLGGAPLKTLAKTAGQTGADFKKAFDKDAGGALQRFLKGLGQLSKSQQLGVLEDLGFNDVRITRTLLGLANNTKLVGEQMNIANEAFKENTALTKEADQRFNTFESQLQITKNTLTDMAITIGSKLLPKITPLLKRLNEFIGRNQAGISAFGDRIASEFEKVATAIQKVDWTPFIEGLKISADVAKTVITAFRSLPEDLQKLVIAGVALNKVTGGLGTSIAKDIGSELIKNFAQRGSSPANPLFVTDVSGGIGKAGAVAGGAGLVGKAVSVAQKVFIVGMLAEVADLISGPVQQLGRDIGKALPLGQERADAGNALQEWIKTAPWPFGTKGQPDWAGGDPTAGLEVRVGHVEHAVGQNTLATVAATERAEARADQNASHMLAAARTDAAHQRSLLTATRNRIEANRIAVIAGAAKQAAKAERVALAVRRVEAAENRQSIAQRVLGSKIDNAKRAQVAAALQTARAIRAKDLSVTVRNSIIVKATVSTRAGATAQAIQNNYYNVPT